jgi:hypothetical protein
MKIIYPYFQNSTTDYARLRAVFEKSARRHMPDAELVCIELDAAQKWEDKHALTTRAFFAKLNEVEKHTGNLVVCDCDLFFTNTLQPVFDNESIAKVQITERYGYKYRWNSGIFFVNKTEEKKPYFLTEWEQETAELRAIAQLKNNKYRTPEIVKKHGGYDQAALDIAIHFTTEIVAILPTWAWNACQSDWHQTDNSTRVYHIKSGLRKIVLDPAKEQSEKFHEAPPRVQEIARMWWAEESI